MDVKWPEHFAAEVVGVSNESSALSSICIALEAWRRGLEVIFTGANLERYSIADGQRAVDFHYSRPQSITKPQDYEKLDRKADTIALLQEEGIPAPVGTVIDPKTSSVQDLYNIAQDIGYPLVIKPNVGSFGAGVLTGLMDWKELTAGYAYLLEEFNPDRVVIEQHHTGDDYRILVVGDQAVGAVRRVPAHVLGDGRNSIARLIAMKNRARKRNPFLSGGLIKIDYEVEKCLAEQRLELEDIPGTGQHVTLRRVANASAGGDVVDVTEKISDTIKSAAVRAVNAIPSVVVAGVDILYDESKAENNYVVIEMNSRPQIGVNMYPSVGDGRDAPRAIIDTLFPQTQRDADELLRTVRFDCRKVASIIRSGITSKVVLPPIPDHGYPYRTKVIYGSGTSLESNQLPRAALESIVHKYKISGHFRFTSNGEYELAVAAYNERTAYRLIDKISSLLKTQPSQKIPWDSTVTTGFTFLNM